MCQTRYSHSGGHSRPNEALGVGFRWGVKTLMSALATLIRVAMRHTIRELVHGFRHPMHQEEKNHDHPNPVRPVQHTRQLSLGLFPTAPGRRYGQASSTVSAAALLRQPERSGDLQRSLPIHASLIF